MGWSVKAQGKMRCVPGLAARGVASGFSRLYEHAFDAPVRHEPYEGDEDVQSAGDPWAHEGRRYGQHIEEERAFPFPILSDCDGEEGAWTLLGNDGVLKNEVSDTGHQ